MPSRPPTLCRHPGCPALVHDGSGLCAAHQGDRRAAGRRYDAVTRKNTPALAAAAKLRNSAAWQQTRDLIRAKHPFCCDPLGQHPGFPIPTAQIHHIEPLATRPDLAYEETNLAPVCVACHAEIEAMERRGDATGYLFADFIQNLTAQT